MARWEELAEAAQRRYSANEVQAWRLRARDWAEQQPGNDVDSTLNSTSPRWPHQEACLRACRQFLVSGPQQRDFFVQIATGGGKSLIMADLLAELDEGGRACVIVPKLDLMEQVAQLLEAMALPGISRVGTGYTPDMDARIFVISDYTVLVPFMTAGDPKPSLVQLIQDLPAARRILAFCNTVHEAKQFAQLLNAAGVPAGHYNGCTAGSQRTRILGDFEHGPSRGGLRVLVTVEVLSEGVDLPMADTCLFVEPRKGLRLRQCVGRVLRRHPQKVDALVVSPPIIQEADGGLQADGELVRLLSELAGADDEFRRSLAQNSFGRVSIVDQRINRIDDSPSLSQAKAATLLSTKVYPRALSSYLTADAQWKLGLAQLIRYKKSHGHCRVPRRHRTGSDFGLGSWVSTQRSARQAHKLTVQLVDQLDSLAFVWDLGQHSWEQSFQRLNAYKHEHGHTAAPRSYVDDDGFNLGSWVVNQRWGQGTGRLEPEQIEQLDLLGFVWDLGQDSWAQSLQRLKVYKHEHGHTAVPGSYVADDGFKLGSWVYNQRRTRTGQRSGRWDPKRIEQLELLGFVWDLGQHSWEQSFQRLNAYKHEHGHTAAPRSYVADDGFKLGSWVHTQRQARKGQGTGRLEPEQIEQLDLLGFVWDLGQDSWAQSLQRLKVYKHEHGHTAVPGSYVADDGFKLGSWVYNQRRTRTGQRSGRWDPKRIEQLELLGFVWDLGQHSWEQSFQRLNAYKHEHGHTAAPRSYVADDGFKLGSWVHTQRQARKGQGTGRLEPEQIEQLDLLGFVWDLGQDSWAQSLQRLKVYKHEHGHTAVPGSYVADDGFKLGSWVYNQRRTRTGQRSGRWDPKRIEQLELLGFSWGKPRPSSDS
ncbi:unnamed protein product [Polarella glacialis]|uniref:Helicase C-terminal domain-containing protein n=1 Tax=Polarella glacialis TaxID=89957 RepID=A0A813DVI1_POLGL|nr:unnamed protein product [Polarella glacialis]